jgi:hypothetical protein
MLDHARRNDFGGWIQHTADGALRAQPIPLAGARIDAFQRAPRELAAVLMEVPIRDAVDAGHHRSVRPEQRLHQVHHPRHLVRLERDEHIVLRAEFARVAGATDLGHPFLAFDQQPHAVCLHRRQMGPAGDETDVRPASANCAPM